MTGCVYAVGFNVPGYLGDHDSINYYDDPTEAVDALLDELDAGWDLWADGPCEDGDGDEEAFRLTIATIRSLKASYIHTVATRGGFTTAVMPDDHVYWISRQD